LWFQVIFADGTTATRSPDGVLFDILGGTCTIIEVKKRHTSIAFAQLRFRYLPILRAALAYDVSSACRAGGGIGMGPPSWSFRLVEIATAFDPEDKGSEPVVHIIKDLGEAKDADEGVNFLSFRADGRKWW
jgi:hypothetical protein